MTDDDIIRMARVAGVRDDGHRFEFSEYKYLERFAALAAAHEREAIAKLADSSVNADKYPTLTMLAQAIRMRGD